MPTVHLDDHGTTETYVAMVLIWKCAGAYTFLFYFVALTSVNADAMLHCTPSRFGEINWWLPALLTAGFNAWLLNFLHRMSDKADPEIAAGHILQRVGSRLHFFRIPLAFWTPILLVLGLIGLGQVLIPRNVRTCLCTEVVYNAFQTFKPD